MRLFLKIIPLFLLFSIGEIAISFSDKIHDAQNNSNENSSFVHSLHNEYSELENMQAIDHYLSLFMQQHNIHGASVAVCRDQKLIYAKGIGYANIDSGEKVGPGHLFRLASISKLITAVAVMKLYEEGKLSLDDQVFGYDGILPFLKFPEYADKRIEQITVRHLLNHSAGWSRHHGDPIFNTLYIARKYKKEPPAELDLVIHDVLQRPLDFEPGTVYSYSNLGYVILGEIISIKSGIPYEDYVILNIFKPLGLQDFYLGRSFYHQKLPDEVTYYGAPRTGKSFAYDGSGQLVPNAYGGNNMEILAAAGGWIASAPELAKFLVAIDPSRKDLRVLKKETLNMMVNPTVAGNGLFGWRGADQSGTSWRTGSLSGSTSLIMRQSNGITWVVLLNGSANTSYPVHNQIAAAMYAAQNNISHWPDKNLFDINSLTAKLIAK